MKKCILLAIIIFLSFASGAWAKESKLILTTQEWLPYQATDGHSLDGISVKVVECVLGKMEQPYEIKVYPWNRSQLMVKQGKAHGFFAASQNTKRDQYATISSVIAEQKWNWYLPQHSLLDPGHPFFKQGALVSAGVGSNMLNWLKEKGYQVIIESYNTEKLAELLAMGRLDAVLANEQVMIHILNQKKLPRDSFKVFVNRNKPLGVYFSKAFLEEESQFLTRFNALVSECR